MATRGMGITPARRELAQGSRKGNPQSFAARSGAGERGDESDQGLYRFCGLVCRARLYRAVAGDLARFGRQAVRRLHLLPRRLAQPAGFAVQFGASAAAAAGLACARIFVGGVRHHPAAGVCHQALAARGRRATQCRRPRRRSAARGAAAANAAAAAKTAAPLARSSRARISACAACRMPARRKWQSKKARHAASIDRELRANT